MKSVLLLVLMLSVFVAGCISPQIQLGTPSQYELPGLLNTTILYLNISMVQVVENLNNTTSARVIIGDSSQSNFINPVAVDHSGKNVSFNVSKERSLGKNYANFNFSSPFSGFIAFTMADGQDIFYTLTKKGAVEIILPVNFTAGSRFLGVMQPAPDNITHDAAGREVLFWNDPYPENKQIRIKYQHKNTADLLVYFFISLLLCAILVMGYYYLTLSSMRKKRMIMEKDIRK